MSRISGSPFPRRSRVWLLCCRLRDPHVRWVRFSHSPIVTRCRIGPLNLFRASVRRRRIVGRAPQCLAVLPGEALGTLPLLLLGRLGLSQELSWVGGGLVKEHFAEQPFGFSPHIPIGNRCRNLGDKTHHFGVKPASTADQ